MYITFTNNLENFKYCCSASLYDPLNWNLAISMDISGRSTTEMKRSKLGIPFSSGIPLIVKILPISGWYLADMSNSYRVEASNDITESSLWHKRRLEPLFSQSLPQVFDNAHVRSRVFIKSLHLSRASGSLSIPSTWSKPSLPDRKSTKRFPMNLKLLIIFDISFCSSWWARFDWGRYLTWDTSAIRIISGNKQGNKLVMHTWHDVSSAEGCPGGGGDRPSAELTSYELTHV